MTVQSEKVFVVSSVSVNHFYVYLEKHLRLEKELFENLKKEAQNANLAKHLEKNQIYLVNVFGEWFRGRLLDSNKSTGINKLLLIDYGRICEINDSSKIKVFATKIFQMLKPRAMKCSLDLNFDLCDEGNLSKSFEKLVNGRALFKMVYKRKQSDKMIIDLITVNCVLNLSITDYLTAFPPTFEGNSACEVVKQIPICEINDGDQVKLSHVESPSEFFVVRADSFNIAKLLNEFYRKHPLKFSRFYRGGFYACIDENKNWHRAQILSIVPTEELCEVLLIDSGKKFWTGLVNVFQLDEKFFGLERQAVKCSLADIEPITESWSSAAKFVLNSVLDLRAPIDLKIAGKASDGSLSVKLYAHYYWLKINVNQAMVHFKVAKLLPDVQDEPCFEDLRKVPVFAPEENNKVKDLVNVELSNGPLDYRIRCSQLIKCVEHLLKRFNYQCVPKRPWSVGDTCLVQCKTFNDNRLRWRRALIHKIEERASLYLLDYEENKTKSLEKLAYCPLRLKNIDVSGNVDELLKESKFLNIEGNGNSESSNCEDFSSPDENTKLELESDKSTWTVLEYAEEYCEEREKFKELDEMKEKIANNIEFMLGSTINIGNYEVQLTMQSGKKWLKPEPMKMAHFIAIPTNVDESGTLHVYNFIDKENLDMVNRVINAFCEEMRKDEIYRDFEVGDACLAQFVNDSRFYRAVIVNTFRDSCDVRFVDYGNIQRTSLSKILSKVICWEVPSFSQKYRLSGCLPSKSECVNLQASFCDILHDYIVDQPILIDVNEEDIEIEGPRYVKRCVIEVKGEKFHNYKEFLKFYDWYKN